MTPARWTDDAGAIPGEPCAYLDVPDDGNLLDVTAVVMPLDTQPTQYEGVLAGVADWDDFTHSPAFATRVEAQDWVEAHRPLPAIVSASLT